MMKFIPVLVATFLSANAFATTQIVCDDNSKSLGFHDHSQDMYYNEGVNAVIDRLNIKLAALPSSAKISELVIAGGEPFKFSKVCVTVTQE